MLLKNKLFSSLTTIWDAWRLSTPHSSIYVGWRILPRLCSHRLEDRPWVSLCISTSAFWNYAQAMFPSGRLDMSAAASELVSDLHSQFELPTITVAWLVIRSHLHCMRSPVSPRTAYHFSTNVTTPSARALDDLAHVMSRDNARYGRSLRCLRIWDHSRKPFAHTMPMGVPGTRMKNRLSRPRRRQRRVHRHVKLDQPLPRRHRLLTLRCHYLFRCIRHV
ncbi:hypothetical protein C8Q72DRAFT_629260 [Fomitopsis betulina]|nr:hypothetical protein C8Q72DRAFT_629260 [Fomitopsis betulina]